MRKTIAAIYTNGNHRVILCTDGTKIKETGRYEQHADDKRILWVASDEDHMTHDFPENFDIKITDYCDAGCPYCHENSTIHGKHGDLKKIEPMLNTLQAGTEVAIGGGNALAHPQLEWFLNKLKELHVFANLTINQKHVKQYQDTIRKYIADNLVNGIGISLTDSSNTEDFEIIKTFNSNVVIHVIAGILTEKDFEVLRDKKVLILGYKILRRGDAYLHSNFAEVNHNIDMLRNVWLKQLKEDYNCKFSFDCLGLEQLTPQHSLDVSDEKFKHIFQGEDTDVLDNQGRIKCSTMYIDAVNMQVARMSTAALDKRFDFTGNENIRDLFKLSIQAW